MPNIKLTAAAIAKLPIPQAGQRFYSTDTPGLKVRVTKSGKKAYVAEKWSREHRRPLRSVISDVSDLTPFQARQEAARRVTEIALGKSPVEERRKRQAQGVTVREVHHAYMKARKNLAASTVRDYNRAANKYLADWCNRPIFGIARDDVEQRHAQLGERCGEAQANLCFRWFRALFNFAVEKYATDREIPPTNPVKRLNAAKAWYRIERRQTYIKPTQLRSWFEALELEDEHTRDYFEVLILTGLRRGEAARLSWKYIDLEHRTLTVPDPKNKQPHTLPLSDYLLALFKRRKGESCGQWVFPGTGKSGHYEDPKKAIARIVEASSVTFTPHDLRRTFITIAESLDISAYAVKRLANHKLRNDVTSGYIVTDIERLREPMQRITNFILTSAGRRKSAAVLKLKKSLTAA